MASLRDRDRRLTGHDGQAGYPCLLRQDRQLLLGRQARTSSAAKERAGVPWCAADRRAWRWSWFARALQADHEDDARRQPAQIELARFAAEQIDQMVVHDLDHHLPRADAPQHLLTDRALSDRADEVSTTGSATSASIKAMRISRRAASTSASRRAPRASADRTRRQDGWTSSRTWAAQAEVVRPARTRVGKPGRKGGVGGARETLGVAALPSQGEAGDFDRFSRLRSGRRWPLLRAMDELTFHKMHGLGNDPSSSSTGGERQAVAQRRAGPADRRPPSGRGLRSAAQPRAVGARGRVHAGVQSGRFRIRRLWQRHPLRRPSGHGGAGRRARDGRDRGRGCSR